MVRIVAAYVLGLRRVQKITLGSPLHIGWTDLPKHPKRIMNAVRVMIM